jgi:hypothetical protein
LLFQVMSSMLYLSNFKHWGQYLISVGGGVEIIKKKQTFFLMLLELFDRMLLLQ